MFTVLIILLGLVIVAVVVLVLRNARVVAWSDADEYPPEDSPDI